MPSLSLAFSSTPKEPKVWHGCCTTHFTLWFIFYMKVYLLHEKYTILGIKMLTFVNVIANIDLIMFCVFKSATKEKYKVQTTFYFNYIL